jgi:uncharacterized protein involved in response to NO
MAIISIEDPRPRAAPPKGFALFALGFRPFFLGAGLSAVLLMALWLALYRSAAQFGLHVPPVLWHAHEMIFGFTGAVIAGFLLTAVQNWTQIRTPRGTPLMVLFALWVSARIAPFLPGLPVDLAALPDLLFFPAVMIAIARPIVRVKQARNYAFPIMLAMLSVANLLVQGEMLGWMHGTARVGSDLAVYMIVLMIVMMGGRVIPSFTDSKLRSQARRWKALEWLAPATTLAVLAAVLADPLARLTGLVAAFAAAVHCWRLYGWHTRRLWSVPLLWVLHLGYGWIVLGFALVSLSTLGWVASSVALHAFTAGAIGTLTLGMMARVALGHTGRLLEPAKIMGLAFVLIGMAALVRVGGPLAFPKAYDLAILLSGVLWMLAFGIFALLYLPILIRPRVDGKEG